MVSVDILLVRVNKVSKMFMMFAQNLSEMRESPTKKFCNDFYVSGSLGRRVNIGMTSGGGRLFFVPRLY